MHWGGLTLSAAILLPGCTTADVATHALAVAAGAAAALLALRWHRSRSEAPRSRPDELAAHWRAVRGERPTGAGGGGR